MDGIQP